MSKTPEVATLFRRAGSRNWQIRWLNETGVEVRRSTHAEEIEASVSPPVQLSLLQAVKHFLAHHSMKETTRRNYQTSLRLWLKLLGEHHDIQLITRDHVANFVAQRLRAGTGTPAIRQDLACLSSVIRHAQLLPGGPEQNVVRNYPRTALAPPKVRERYLTRPEATRLLQQLPEGPKRGIVETALETGMRRSEVLRLAWSEIDEERRLVRLTGHRTKTGKPRVIPLSPTVLHRLGRMSRRGKWVFANPSTGEPYFDPQPWFPKAVREAELGDFHFHDLRHTFASWWIQRRGSIRILQEILGHQSAQTTKRYTHLEDDHLTSEFARVWG